MNTPIPPLLQDGVLYIDNSSMELFTTCARQAYYYIIRRRELNRSRIALDFGGAVHSVLEFLYKTYGTSYRSASDNNAIINYAAAQVLNTPEDDYRTRSYLISAVQHYLNTYPAESFELAKIGTDTLAVEVPFMFPLGTVDSTVFGPIKVVWTGKIDMLYRSRGNLGVLDHKTTSMMGPQFFAEFEIAHQMYGYAAAAEYITGEQVPEITINALGCRKPTKTGVAFQFERHIIPVTRPLLEEWHVDSLTLVSDFISSCERGYFPKMTKWCVGKYGACQYRSVCTMNPEHRELALSTSEYRNVTWNPLSPKATSN